MNKSKNMVMIALAAVILVAVNAGVLMAANKEVIVPIGNLALWGAFVVLNVVSILWAVTLLGLQPIIIALSYVAGGALAYFGVRDLAGVSVAELTTAGATYGAFGALAIGNATQKVRLAFFKKGQVPFIFIIVGLLVVDAGLNSGISSAGFGVIVRAVVLPFAIAGGVIGLVWSLLNRAGIGRKPSEVLATVDGVPDAVSEAKPEKLVIKMPESAPVAAVAEPIKVAKPAPKHAPKHAPKPTPKPVPEPVVIPQPVVAKVAPVAKKKEEAFIPLEIDTSAAEPEEKDETPFAIPTFDARLYGIGKDEESGTVMVKDPDPVVEQESAAKKPAPEAKGDWLGGHLDLLNKLK